MGQHRNQLGRRLLTSKCRDGLCLKGRLEIAAAYPTLQQRLEIQEQRAPNSEARQKAQSSSSISQLIGVGGGNRRRLVWRLRTNQTLRAAVSARTDACLLVGCSDMAQRQGQGWGRTTSAQGIFHPSFGAQAKPKPDRWVSFGQYVVHQMTEHSAWENNHCHGQLLACCWLASNQPQSPRRAAPQESVQIP